LKIELIIILGFKLLTYRKFTTTYHFPNKNVFKVLGRDIEFDVNTEVNTDVDVHLNINELARTDGIVSYPQFSFEGIDKGLQLKEL
jgi:hypothetical protein